VRQSQPRHFLAQRQKPRRVGQSPRSRRSCPGDRRRLRSGLGTVPRDL